MEHCRKHRSRQATSAQPLQLDHFCSRNAGPHPDFPRGTCLSAELSSAEETIAGQGTRDERRLEGRVVQLALEGLMLDNVIALEPLKLALEVD